jgi:glycine/D-amino acid oxidase-like deaminating enzyme
MANQFDIAVIGGGVVGCAIAWGLARCGQRVAVLDEGDVAYRASRGNFALVWVQSKGFGMPRYAAWTMRSANAWAGFADTLAQETGIDVAHSRPGGFTLTLSEDEWLSRRQTMERLQSQPGMQRFEWTMLDREGVKRMLPQIGPDVTGGSYTPFDGHCNALRLLRALNKGMQQLGVVYLPEHHVTHLERRAGEFRLTTGRSEIRAAKIVIAAGIGSARLGALVGLDIRVRPERGQLIVTEKTAPFLHFPMSRVRQTDEGGVMIGDSQEEADLDNSVTLPVISTLAHRAMRIFPQLARLNVVRTWACLRVMTQDRFPIYEQSESCPGAFSAACHSGITLAAAHALFLAPRIVEGSLPADEFEAFSSKRFNVPAIAA